MIIETNQPWLHVIHIATFEPYYEEITLKETVRTQLVPVHFYYSVCKHIVIEKVPIFEHGVITTKSVQNIIIDEIYTCA